MGQWATASRWGAGGRLPKAQPSRCRYGLLARIIQNIGRAVAVNRCAGSQGKQTRRGVNRLLCGATVALDDPASCGFQHMHPTHGRNGNWSERHLIPSRWQRGPLAGYGYRLKYGAVTRYSNTAVIICPVRQGGPLVFTYGCTWAAGPTPASKPRPTASANQTCHECKQGALSARHGDRQRGCYSQLRSGLRDALLGSSPGRETGLTGMVPSHGRPHRRWIPTRAPAHSL